MVLTPSRGVHSSRRGWRLASRSELYRWFVLLVSLCPSFACADTLRITGSPSGASVEINGVTVGTTPSEDQLPGYFHKTKTALGRRLQHSMIRRISLAGMVLRKFYAPLGPQ
jgi:hypothetical protein